MGDKLITDPTELGSFLVPAYGFRDLEQARGYRKVAYEGRILMPPQTLKGQYCNAPSYVMIPGWWMDSLGTSMLTDRPVYRSDLTWSSERWETLHKVGQDKPNGGYLIGLMVEGRRQYFRHTTEKRHVPEWVRRLNSGSRDCYAVWSRTDGSEFDVTSYFQDDRGRMKNLYVGRSGRGAIYAATTVFNNAGKAIGNEARLLLIEFAILDKDASRDSVLRLTWRAQSHYFAQKNTVDTFPMNDLSHRELDNNWIALANRARDGFIINRCKTADPDLVDYGVFMTHQIELIAADKSKPYGERFTDRIEQMDWQEALRNCREPWQLETVVHHFRNRDEFMEVPGAYDGTPATRVGNMLRAHTCDDLRREQLSRWIRNFVAPRDNLWNYTGD